MAGLLHDPGKAAIRWPCSTSRASSPTKSSTWSRATPSRAGRCSRKGRRRGRRARRLPAPPRKMDGTGYPDRLGHDKLSTIARMAAICDVYDAVTSGPALQARLGSSRIHPPYGRMDQGPLGSAPVPRPSSKSIGIYPDGSLGTARQSGRIARGDGAERGVATSPPRSKVFSPPSPTCAFRPAG